MLVSKVIVFFLIIEKAFFNWLTLPSDPKTIPWKDNILTSRFFKSKKSLIQLLSAKVADPSLINLGVLNDDKTSLHEKTRLLDIPHNLVTQNGDLTYLLPEMLKKWTTLFTWNMQKSQLN